MSESYHLDYLAGHVPDEPFDKALHVAVKWFFPTDQKQYSDGQSGHGVLLGHSISYVPTYVETNIV